MLKSRGRAGSVSQKCHERGAPDGPPVSTGQRTASDRGRGMRRPLPQPSDGVALPETNVGLAANLLLTRRAVAYWPGLRSCGSLGRTVIVKSHCKHFQVSSMGTDGSDLLVSIVILQRGQIFSMRASTTIGQQSAPVRGKGVDSGQKGATAAAAREARKDHRLFQFMESRIA